jgi:hypothetical protein
MAVTIIFKTKVSTSLDPDALKKLKLCKEFGCIFPMSEGSEADNKAFSAMLAKAIKREKKLLAKCELKIAQRETVFKKAALYYLSDKRCLLVNLFEQNARQPIQNRRSIAQLVALANEYSVLKCLNEPAKIWTVPKVTGGQRTLCSFGPVARALQRMCVKLLRMTYQPHDFQFTHLGSAQKVQLAMSLIKQKGYTHVAEIDIKDFFPSFLEKDLIAALPLPKEATRQITMANSANWSPSCSPTEYSYILSPLGIPQGSVFSPEVAHWCIANMVMEKIEGVEIINHVDNFFIFAITKDRMEKASKALSCGIAGLLGGDFKGKVEQTGEIAQGFRMLGCWITFDKSGEIQVDPTETNYRKLTGRMERQKQWVYAKLTAATLEKDECLRTEGLQDYLRLESVYIGWTEAFKFCGKPIEDVASDYADELGMIRQTFDISDYELMPLKDKSTVLNIKWYSGK